jgi:nitrogen fixation-related uncharacterized protein
MNKISILVAGSIYLAAIVVWSVLIFKYCDLKTEEERLLLEKIEFQLEREEFGYGANRKLVLPEMQ